MIIPPRPEAHMALRPQQHILEIAERSNRYGSSKVIFDRQTEETTRPVESKRSRGRRKRAIRFNKSVTVRPILHRNDFTEEECSKTWFSKQEYQKLREEQSLAINMMQKCTQAFVVDTESISFWGLDSYTKIGKLRRRTDGLKGMLAVFDEQALQRSQGGDHNVECIRIAYQSATKDVLPVSQQVAQKDEIEAK